MLRSAVLAFFLVLTACSLAVGQSQTPPPPGNGPAPPNPVKVPPGPPGSVITVTPGKSADPQMPKLPDAQTEPDSLRT